MRIAVETRPAPHEAAFLNLLADTCGRLGHEVERVELRAGLDVGDLLIQWGCLPAGIALEAPTLHAELGWLPRWHYQLSHTGINAKHHLAAPTLAPLAPAQERAVELHLRECRAGHNCPFPYADPRVPPAENVPADGFVLAPLQMPQDTNMENAPEHLRTEQGFIDAVSEMDPPWPVVFKQHCHSGAGYQTRLRCPRVIDQFHALPDPRVGYLGTDRIAPHAEATIHAYLKHPACRAVVTINSNTAHDALIWGVPVVALGDGVWPQDRGPFFTRPIEDENDWRYGVQNSRAVGGKIKSAYVHHLVHAQWKLEDATDMGRVARAIMGATA